MPPSMHLARLALAATMVAALSAAASAKQVNVNADTNLRKAPGTTSEVITLIPKGEKVEADSCDAGWCKVSWNGRDGYAIGRNLAIGLPTRKVAQHYRKSYRPRYYVEDYDDDGGPAVYDPSYLQGYFYGPRVYYGYYPHGGPYWGGAWGWRARRW